MQYKIIVDKQPSSNPSDERKEYTIDIEELRVKGSVYDSINITPDRTYVTRRLTLSEYGVLSELVPSQEEDLGDLNIELFEGDNYIYLYEMTGNRFCAEYVVKNDFTDDFATKNEMNSAITQTAQNIELSVNQKLTGYSTTEQMNAAIKLSASSITSTVSKTYATKTELTTAKTEIKQTTDSITSTVSQKVGKTEIASTINQTAQSVKINASKIDLSAYVTITNLKTSGKTTINGSNITTGTIDASKVNVTNLNASNIKSGTITGRAISGGTITGTQITNGNNFKVDKNGNLTCNNATITNAQFQGNKIELNPENNEYASMIIYEPNNKDENNNASLSWYNLKFGTYNGYSADVYCDDNNAFVRVEKDFTQTVIYHDHIVTPSLSQTSQASEKKNFERLNNALDLINKIDIYKYNLKHEKDTDKKHIGFVIGKGYKYRKEVTNKENTGAEIYSLASLGIQGIKELDNRLTKLEKLLEVS